ncbi:cation:proton antiporter [Actinomadura oligospora]|uniref:cation:proton antiporter n=1 Tax=Actinomadura oligospora TaxID=111804 RepID=UPI001FE0880E|nr:cation:proton antiporter [Actinomadura oligospora]
MAFLLGRLGMRFGMPAIVGELCAGVLLGPSVLARFAPDVSGWLLPRDPARFHILDASAQLGVLLLVALTGMHMDLSLMRRRGTTALRISMGGLLIPLGLGVGVGFLLPGSLVPGTAERPTFALFIGIAMAVSAIPVIAKTLMDLRLVHRNVGQLTLSAVMVDDIVGWLLLSVVSAMATTGIRASELTISLLWPPIVIVAAVALRGPVAWTLRAAGRAEGDGPTVTVVVLLVLAASAATQAVKLEAVFGAFVAGLVITGTGALDRDKIRPLQTIVLAVLAPLFFATAGLRMDLGALARPVVLLTGLGVLAVAVAGKFAGAYLGARLSGLDRWEGLALGAGMNARGVIEVIIAMVGLRLGVLSPEMYTIVILVAIVTSLMAPPVLRATMARVEHTAEEQLRARELGGADAAPDGVATDGVGANGVATEDAGGIGTARSPAVD